MQTKIPLQSYKTKLKIHIDPGLVKPCFEKPGPGNYWAQSIFFQLFSFQIYLRKTKMSLRGTWTTLLLHYHPHIVQ